MRGKGCLLRCILVDRQANRAARPQAVQRVLGTSPSAGGGNACSPTSQTNKNALYRLTDRSVCGFTGLALTRLSTSTTSHIATSRYAILRTSLSLELCTKMAEVASDRVGQAREKYRRRVSQAREKLTLSGGSCS